MLKPRFLVKYILDIMIINNIHVYNITRVVICYKFCYIFELMKHLFNEPLVKTNIYISELLKVYIEGQST